MKNILCSIFLVLIVGNIHAQWVEEITYYGLINNEAVTMDLNFMYDGKKEYAAIGYYYKNSDPDNKIELEGIIQYRPYLALSRENDSQAKLLYIPITLQDEEGKYFFEGVLAENKTFFEGFASNPLRKSDPFTLCTTKVDFDINNPKYQKSLFDQLIDFYKDNAEKSTRIAPTLIDHYLKRLLLTRTDFSYIDHNLFYTGKIIYENSDWVALTVTIKPYDWMSERSYMITIAKEAHVLIDACVIDELSEVHGIIGQHETLKDSDDILAIYCDKIDGPWGDGNLISQSVYHLGNDGKFWLLRKKYLKIICLCLMRLI